jgi:glycosyltransferase involved in cell wall biosynthesis
MKIVQITPGSGDSFYCENCLRDAVLAKAMRMLGHDVVVVPLYLPLVVDADEQVSNGPIFFGGINVYLQQKSAIFRKTPRWIDRFFDQPGLLKRVGRKAGMTSAKVLGQTTVSMLQGEHGRQAKEFERLADWLSADEHRPEIVCISNILLAGLTCAIKKRICVPVVCLLQDEDEFLDGLTSPCAEEAWEIVAECSRDIDAFVSVSKYYAEVIRQRLGLGAERINVVYMGIELQRYESISKQPQVPTIGYLSRMCFDKGLDVLVDAFIKIKKSKTLKNAKLRVAGGKRADDEPFLDQIRQKLAHFGFIDDVEFLPDFDHDARLAFLQTLSVLSVPERKPVAYGLYVLEALAAGVPVVEPAIGAFPELLEMTGGGLLYQQNDTESLSRALESLLIDHKHAQKLGEKGRNAIFEKFAVEQTAQQILRIYQQAIHQFQQD